jgi:nitrogenase molybdenum-cofactor synthesis protein NifE
MIGDDLEAVCKAAAKKLGKPVIPVNVPGFVGSKNLGNKLAGEALLDYVIGTEEPAETTPYDINIIGEYNLSGELWQVKPLLDELGIRILACISGDAKYHEVARSHRARAAMMVCSKAMINVARKMEERYGIPYFEGSFYGIGDMSDPCAKSHNCSLTVALPRNCLAVPKPSSSEKKLAHGTGLLLSKRGWPASGHLLFTGGVKSWSVVAAMQEVGLTVIGTSVKKSTPDDKERIKEIMKDDAHMYDDLKPREMYKC